MEVDKRNNEKVSRVLAVALDKYGLYQKIRHGEVVEVIQVDTYSAVVQSINTGHIEEVLKSEYQTIDNLLKRNNL